MRPPYSFLRGSREVLCSWGFYARTGALHEVTPSVAPKAVRMLMMVWIMNFQVSFLLIVLDN